MEKAREKLKEFNARRKLKGGMLGVMAVAGKGVKKQPKQRWATILYDNREQQYYVTMTGLNTTQSPGLLYFEVLPEERSLSTN